MKLHYPLIILASILLCACGGGGGSGNDNNDTSGDPSSSGTDQTPPADNGESTGGDSSSSGASNAKIIFPANHSGALSNTLTVHGTASDADGVLGVTVNGVSATLIPASESSEQSKDSGVQRSANSYPRAEESGSGVEWTAEVPLQLGDNQLNVSVEDQDGAVTDSVEEATVNYTEVPDLFASDRDDPRLVGWGTTLGASGYTAHLVAFNYSTGEEVIYPDFHEIGPASCLRGVLNAFVYLMQNGDMNWSLRSFDLETGVVHTIADIPPELLPTNHDTGPMWQLACDGAHDDVYALVNYWNDGKWVDSRVLKIDSAGNVTTLTQTDTGQSPLWIAREIALSNEALVSVADISSTTAPTRISLSDGTRSELAPIDVGGLQLIATPHLERLYVATMSGVNKVELGDPPNSSNISVVDTEDPLSFSEPASMALDLTGNRIIVGDTDLDTLVEVDLATGSRAAILSRRVGAGPAIIDPERLALASDGMTAYVADGGGNRGPRLFSVDLATGNRTVVLQRAIGSMNALALDEDNNIAYVGRYTEALLKVDLDDGTSTAITSGTDGMLAGVADIVFDAANHRLLVADAVTDSIVSVDAVSLQKQLVSKDGERGVGESMTTLSSISMTEDGKYVYAATSENNEVLRVNLDTGDREVVESSCPHDAMHLVSRVLYKAQPESLLIVTNNGVYVLGLDTQICTEIPAKAYPYDIRISADGRLFATTAHAVIQMDKTSGDVVIVSK